MKMDDQMQCVQTITVTLVSSVVQIDAVNTGQTLFATLKMVEVRLEDVDTTI